MSDYAKQLEEQNEELKQLLATQETLVADQQDTIVKLKRRLPKWYYVDIDSVDNNFKPSAYCYYQLGILRIASIRKVNNHWVRDEDDILIPKQYITKEEAMKEVEAFYNG